MLVSSLITGCRARLITCDICWVLWGLIKLLTMFHLIAFFFLTASLRLLQEYSDNFILTLSSFLIREVYRGLDLCLAVTEAYSRSSLITC